MIGALLADLWPWLIAALAAVAGVLGYGARQKSKGREDERRQQKEADHDRADEIRSRVERDRDERLRRYDDAGWRD